MIETRLKLPVRLLAALALTASAACDVSASGQIPCVDDSSCPSDYPVCSSGKCIAGTSAASVAIVAAEGHVPADFVRGTVRVDVTGRASTGVKSVTLGSGSKSYTPIAASVPPLFQFDVPTTDFGDGDVSFTAALTAGDGTSATSSAFVLHIDNSPPGLTFGTVTPTQATNGTLITIDVTASEALSSISGTVSGVSTALAQVSAPTGLTYHFGYAVTSSDAAGARDVTITANDLAGNSTTKTLTGAFTVAPVPTITSFSASPTVISSGSSSTLSAVFNAGTGGSATVDHGVGTVSSPLGVSVSPGTTTTYTLTVTNAAGAQVQASATVTVGAIPVLTFTKAAASILPGGSVNLTANVSNAVSAEIDPGAISVATDGSNHVTAVSPTVTTTYTLTAVNSAGLASHLTQTITVTPAAVASFTATATPINAGAQPQVTPTFGPVGSTAVISLSTDSSARPCGTTIASTTAVNCTAINSDTTYVLTVTAGTSIATSQVTVQATAASISGFTAAAGTVNAGAQPQLTPSWAPNTGSPAATVTISDGSGSPPCGTPTTSGTQLTCNAINATTVYTLKVQQGTTVATQTVTVIATPASISGFSASSATVNAGAQPKLTPSWAPNSGLPAATVTISDGSGSPPCGTPTTSGTQLTCNAINATTVYTLTVTQGTTVATKTVTVTATPANIGSFTATSSPITSGTAPQLTPNFTPNSGLPAATAVISLATDPASRPCGASATSGSTATCANISENTSYVLTVTAGTTVATATVTVKVNPFFTSFTAVAPTLPAAGGAPQLIPVFGPPNATATITIPPGVTNTCGAVTSGTTSTCPAITATTIYQLNVSANGGPVATTQVTVTVADNPTTGINLTSNANPVTKATSTTSNNFKLTPTYCATCTATIFDGTTTTPAPATGVQTANKTITQTTTFTLTATNAAGESATVDLTEVLLPGSFAATSTATGGFTSGMAQKRLGATVTLLPNGTVLIAGGSSTAGSPTGGRNDAEIYDPVANGFRNLAHNGGSSGTMQDARYEASAVLLPDGRVLISGGQKNNGMVVLSQDWFDPAQDGFRATRPSGMQTARVGHTATLMADNTVMIYGGSTDGTYLNAFATGELYTDGSATNTAIAFSGTAPLTRVRQTATVLADNRVLLAGGIPSSGTSPTTVDIISKSGTTFSGAQPTGTLAAAALFGGHSAVRLSDSRVLLIGGTTTTPLAEIGTISGATASFVATTGAMSAARCNATAINLPNGNVLVAGGNNCANTTALPSAEVFNYLTNSFSATATPVVARQEAGAVFLFNGAGLIAGGDTSNPTAEIFNPN